jgi:predicted RNA methylase
MNSNQEMQLRALLQTVHEEHLAKAKEKKPLALHQRIDIAVGCGFLAVAAALIAMWH